LSEPNGKISILTLIFNLKLELGVESVVTDIVALTSALSMLIASIGGLFQIKNIFAFSGILNISYFLLLIETRSIESLTAYLFFFYQYALTHVAIFFLNLLIGYTTTSNDISYSNCNAAMSNYSPIEYVSQLRNLLKHIGFLPIAFVFCLLSLIGIPHLVAL